MIVDSPKVTARAERALELGCLEYFYLNCAKNLTRKHGHVTRYFHPWTNNETDVYTLPLADYSDTERPQDEETESEQLVAVADTYAALDWYERGLVDLHMNGWSDREIYRRTGITDKEVRRVLRKFRADVLKRKSPDESGPLRE